MHGHARLVEHKIRLWIVQQESNQRKQEQLVRGGARDDALDRRTRRVVALQGRKQWQ